MPPQPTGGESPMSERCLALVCPTIGVAVGAAVGCLDLVGPGGASALAAVLLLAANLVSDSSNEPALLGSICVALGTFLGYGLTAATCELLREPGNGSVAVPLFLAFVALFHLVEFLFTAVCHTMDVEFRAFLLSPVPAGGYSIAMVAALVEFWAEEALLGKSQLLPVALRIVLLGVATSLTLVGQAMRTAALFTARSNFTHLVAYRKEASHRLVQEGVYRWCRHPGYVGWFLWCCSTQLLLGNPLCFVAYFFVTFTFFRSRIPGEEAALVNFFGDEYLEYARHVPCGIPGISRLS